MDSQMDLQELIAKIKEEATACDTIAEVKVLYNTAPHKSEAQFIYETRWMELHLQELEA